MKVRLLIARAVLGASQNRGDIIDVSAEEAKRMIEAEQAEPVREGQAPERAVKRGRSSKS